MELHKNQVSTFEELNFHVENLFSKEVSSSSELDEVLSWESTAVVRDYLLSELENYKEEYLTSETISNWMDVLKKEKKVKGKNLFMGMRGVLTGMGHGPDLKILLTLAPVGIIKGRVQAISL